MLPNISSQSASTQNGERSGFRRTFAKAHADSVYYARLRLCRAHPAISSVFLCGKPPPPAFSGRKTGAQNRLRPAWVPETAGSAPFLPVVSAAGRADTAAPSPPSARVSPPCGARRKCDSPRRRRTFSGVSPPVRAAFLSRTAPDRVAPAAAAAPCADTRTVRPPATLRDTDAPGTFRSVPVAKRAGMRPKKRTPPPETRAATRGCAQRAARYAALSILPLIPAMGPPPLLRSGPAYGLARARGACRAHERRHGRMQARHARFTAQKPAFFRPCLKSIHYLYTTVNTPLLPF